MNSDYFSKEYEFLPWNKLTGKEKAEQEKWQKELCEKYNITLGENSVVSKDAFLYEIEGTFGEKTQIGSYALLRRLNIKAGNNCSFNSYCVVHGDVTVGNNVRIAPGAKIFGENHSFKDLDKPICMQPNTRKGIVIEDDVWIGANAVITDGVKVGAHSIVAAGSIVTRDVPPWCVVGGNPARVIKNRLAQKKNDDSFKKMVSDFGIKMRESYQKFLDYRFAEGRFTNSKSHNEQRRAICDAVEIAALFDAVPKNMTREKMVESIKAFQKDENEYECVLSASYALEILGEKPVKFDFVHRIGDVWEYLDSLKWATDAWDAGHYTDIFATACYFNKKYYNEATPKDLFTWLDGHQHSDGLWGEGDINLRVNGYYRLTRGSYDQFKIPVKLTKNAIDTVLEYSKKKGIPDNACDALDIIHPLYFTSGETSYRKSEGEAWCVEMLPVFMGKVTEEGFAFRFGEEASLKGTEMWLSIIYLMCDYLGLADLLSYVPKGVHRTK